MTRSMVLVAYALASSEGIPNIRAWEAISLWRLGRKHEAATAATAFLELTARLWCGEGVPTPNLMCAWFEDAFPVRDNRTRTGLLSALHAAFVEAENLGIAGHSDDAKATAQ